VSSQQLDERLHREVCLSQNRAQRASRQLAMHRDDHRAALLAQLQVAATLAHLGESNLGQSTHDLEAGHHGEARAHAGMSTGAMIGVSM
jgi:hypothetical protein